MVDLAQLASLDDIRNFIREGYRAAGGRNKWSAARPLRFGFEYGTLPLAVAEPGPLIERAVQLAGEDGLSLREAQDLFEGIGKERFDRGMAFARNAGLIRESREKRPNRAGRMQEQVVLYPGTSRAT